MMTEAEKQELFRGLDRVVAILSFHFDSIREVASQDGLPGFHEVLNTLTCEQCNAKLMGLCPGGGFEKVGVLLCMETKDMHLQGLHWVSMN
jgi:hypothetical protein